jgi:hypothetical protein
MSELDWIIKRAKETPSSQDYGIPELPKKQGVKFSSVNLPTEIDLIAARASKIPGPGAYNVRQNALSAAGATKISDANPMSELDWIIKRAKETPSSQDYGIPELPKKQGVKFSSVNLPTEIDLIAMCASKIPGPGAYNVRRNALSGAGVTKISDANPMSELDWIIKRAKETPSSQDYGIPELPRKQGVKFSSVNLPTEIDLIAARASKIPGPGAYGIPDLPRKEGVKFSEFFLPSEIELLMKRSAEVPGPGAYENIDLSKVSKSF